MSRTVKFLVCVLMVLFVSCGGGQITKEKAQRVLDQWKSDPAVKGIEPNRPYTGTTGGGGSSQPQPDLVVQGVQEIPNENSARVNIVFNDFKYPSGGTEASYSGPGTASFSHYNDGRWVLTRVEIPRKVWEGANLKLLTPDYEIK